MIELDYQFITDNASLAELCVSCQTKQAIALDTEFFREDTFYPIPALLQLYDGDTVYLIDPLSINDFSPLTTIFNNESVVKLVHSCSEDLEVFRLLCNTLPTPLFDTQIAAAYCGIGFSMSYQKLVDQLVGQPISKSETRSNWLRRPLSDNQCQYAAHDVKWLIDIYQTLVNKLGQQGRLNWLQEDLDLLLANANNPPSDNLAYLRVKAGWRLDRQQLNVLRALCAWREQAAREHDIPRGRVANDAALIAISQQLSSKTGFDKSALAKIEQLSRAQVHRIGDEILAVVEHGLKQNANTFPPLLRDERLLQQRQTLKVLQGIAKAEAERMIIPVELLARKRDIEEYLLTPEQSLIKNSWRSDILFKLFEQETANKLF